MDQDVPHYDPERTIGINTHCARCGYNLRYGRYAGRCPECGSEYNARPLVRKGILSPGELSPPWFDGLLALTCVVSATYLIVRGAREETRGIVIAGSLCLIPGLLYVRFVFRNLVRYLEHRRAVRNSMDDDE